MFYKEFNIPAVIEIGSNIIGDIDGLLKRNHIYYKSKILFTQKELLELYRNYFNLEEFEQVILVKGGCIEEIKNLSGLKINSDVILIAFGGGSVIDLVKIFATNKNIFYISVPSTLSNDAIYSPVARLFKKGKKTSFGVKSPIGIIVDIEIVLKSPEELLLAGVGDLVSNLSAIKDCKLAIKDKGERIDKFSMSLAQLGASSILSFKKDDLRSKFFIEELANGLIVSGMAMVMDKSTRPASGAEHLISHAIDEHFPTKSTLHGIQVAWAQLIIEEMFREDDSDFRKIHCFFENIGLLDVFDHLICFNKSEFKDLVYFARKIRNRYTVLDKL